MQLTSDSVITFHCPKCNAKLRIPTKLTGVEGPCPSCKAKITAPLTDEDDSSLHNGPPNEIIRKKVSPQKMGSDQGLVRNFQPGFESHFFKIPTFFTFPSTKSD